MAVHLRTPRKRRVDLERSPDSPQDIKRVLSNVDIPLVLPRNVRWGYEERKFLHAFVDASEDKENINWELCSSKLTSLHGTSRSGKACQSEYSRNKQLNTTKEMCCQTDLSFAPNDTIAWAMGTKHNLDVANYNSKKNIVASYPKLHALLVGPSGDSIGKEANIDKEPHTPADPALEHHGYAARPMDTFSKGVEKKKKKLSKVKPSQDTVNKITTVFDIPDFETKAILSEEQYLLIKVALESRLVSTVVSACLAVPCVHNTIIQTVACDVGKRPECMKNRVHDPVSVLMKKDFSSLSCTNMSDIASEFFSKFPELFSLLLALMLNPELRKSREAIEKVIPKLSTIYAIAMQTRNNELSRLQRTVSMCLAGNICDQKVYDRLNCLGVCLSYNRSLAVIRSISGHFNDILIEAAIQKKRIRLIGDNLNFMVGVANETKGNHKHMVHMFASCALVSEQFFLDRPMIPEIPIDVLSVTDVIINREEYKLVRNDCVVLVGRIIARFLPHLSNIKDTLPRDLCDPSATDFAKKTKVVPLSVLPFNEQYYQDDVKILEYYETVLESVIQHGKLSSDTKFQIGGDQLTRERLSRAMNLRIGNTDPKQRFAHIGTITFEFFHLGMNFLEKVVFGQLWSKRTDVLGTMKCEKERILRHSVDADVKKAYDADKDFFLSFFSAYLVDAAMEFFGMESRNDVPTKHAPPAKFMNNEELKTWTYNTLGEFIDEFVFPGWSGFEEDIVHREDRVVEGFLELVLANNMILRIPNPQLEQVHAAHPVHDHTKNHGHLVLELGMVFQYFLQLVKCPERNRFLAVSKMMLTLMKANNPKAKYPLELLRLLVQQYTLLPLQEACQVLQACFVNTRGFKNSHVAADQRMEWIVKENKKHIKHMYSNKSAENIACMSGALPGISFIAENFDMTASVLTRSKGHKKKDSDLDEMTMMDDIREMQPFKCTPERQLPGFREVCKTLTSKLNGYKFREWFNAHKNNIFELRG